MPILPGGDADLQRAIVEAINVGHLRLVGNDDTERAVARPSDIGIGSPSLRLAKPKAAETQDDGSTSSPDGDEVVVSDGKNDDGRKSREVEVQLAFILNSSLAESTRRDAIWKVLSDLANRVDDQYASRMQLVVKVVLPQSDAEALTERAKEAGASPSSTPR